jgi:iron complex transport system substrate-binding protein
LLAILGWAGVFAQCAQAEPAAARVVSVNLCTDQLLLALADRRQIASLSPFVNDKAFSYMAAEAVGLPSNRGNGEDVVRLSADLVLVGAFDNKATRALVEQRGVEVMTFTPWSGLADGREQIRRLAARLGHPERGEALIARIDAALEGVRGIAPTGQSALIVHRNLFVPGGRNVTVDILEAAGFRDVSGELGLKNGGYASLERLIRVAPDYLIVSPGDASVVDQGSAKMVHDAMLQLFPPSRRIPVPDRLTICGGPSTPELIETLGRELRARVGDQRPPVTR